MSATAELHHQVRERLGASGQRYTAGREALVDALCSASGPVTLPELLGGERPLPQSSAYRNLLVMEQAGVVRRLVHSTGHAHYELAEDLTTHHHHLICTSCGAIRDIELGAAVERALDRALTDVTAAAGFSARHHELDIYGECSDCAASLSPRT